MDHEWDYQRAIVAALNAEIGARGWTRKHLGELSGIGEQTMMRIFRCERNMNVQQLGAMADALGITIEHLAAEADRWSLELPGTRGDRPAPRPTDPRGLIEWLLANPSQVATMSLENPDAFHLRTLTLLALTVAATMFSTAAIASLIQAPDVAYRVGVEHGRSGMCDRCRPQVRTGDNRAGQAFFGDKPRSSTWV